jgi:hypothetical protein
MEDGLGKWPTKPMALQCPEFSMAPVVAITGMVADCHRKAAYSTPLERLLNHRKPGRAHLRNDAR